jgi:hypothetical protein
MLLLVLCLTAIALAAAGLIALLACGVRFVHARETRKVAHREARLRDLELRLLRG